MIQAIKLRVLYAIHMIAPLAFAAWHIQRLQPSTLLELRALFS